MNTKNNQRHQDTIAAIEVAFVSLLKEKELKNISVSELCEKAEINRLQNSVFQKRRVCCCKNVV